MLQQLPKRELVLLGAGHTHLHVLRMWKMHPLADTRLTCVSNQVQAAYSGMLPGVLAGQYSASQMQVDLVRRCCAVGARLILADVVGLDRGGKQLLFSDRPPLPYDQLSIGIGSRPAPVPGAGPAVPIKPMQTFLQRLAAQLEQVGDTIRPLRVIVVGGGAGGVELACCLPAFVNRRFPSRALQLTLIDGAPHLLSGSAPAAVRKIERVLDERGHHRLQNHRVTGFTERGVWVESSSGKGQSLEADAVVWAVRAVAPELFSRLDLPCDDAGFLLTNVHLQSLGDASIYVVGDSGTCQPRPHPKSGVYAVRQGPVLWENLQRSSAGRPLRAWNPQPSFLSLLNTGDGRAVLDYKGWVTEGRWCWRLKDRIDRRFMEKHQDYAVAEMLPTDRSHASRGRNFQRGRGGQRQSPEMRCDGCGSKLAGEILRRALSRLENPDSPRVTVGLEDAEDVAVIGIAGGSSVVATVDFFTTFLDDPYTVGRVAALNALSDLFAKGAFPTAALAHAAIPAGSAAQQEHMLFELLAGSLAEFRPLGVPIVGGHSIEGAEAVLGFTLLGEHAPAARLRSKGGLKPGDSLVLTKPLGTGVLLAAHRQARCAGPDLQRLLESMLTSNHAAAEVADKWRLSAVTDVTGFGLVGHLLEMLESSGCAAELDLASVPLLPGAAALLLEGWESTLAEANRSSVEDHLPGEPIRPELWSQYQATFDPQTSGGLLMGVPLERLKSVLDGLQRAAMRPAVIGRVFPRAAGDRYLRWHSPGPLDAAADTRRDGVL